jgi:hypothetical protein
MAAAQKKMEPVANNPTATSSAVAVLRSLITMSGAATYRTIPARVKKVAATLIAGVSLYTELLILLK